MKTFNKIISLFIFSLLIGLTGCKEDEPVWNPSPPMPDTQGVYFPTTTRTVEMEPTAPTEVMITIARTDTVKAMEVPITVIVNTDDVFVVPQKVAFAAMAKTAQIKVTFPTAAEGKAYSLQVMVRGDEYVNPYGAGVPYASVTVTRIKWDPVADPFVFIMDPVGKWGYAIPNFPMYAKAESVKLGTVTRYRFKNLYSITTDPADADGIYNGYPDALLAACPYTDGYYFDDSQDIYTTIEIDAQGNVTWFSHLVGLYFDPAVDGSVSILASATVKGKLANNIITFPAGSLGARLSLYNPTGAAALPEFKIYVNKKTYLADNMKIRDFNVIAYEKIEGAVSEFESKAYSNNWDQIFKKAVDIDNTNPNSEYKNLYYLSDLYAKKFGLAFYYDGKAIKIPAAQPIGLKAFQKDLFVSASETVKSSVTTTAKGVTVYTLGLKFHYKDGTVLGEFAETYFYSKDPIAYTIDDFCGNYTMTGPSMFDLQPANRAVTIEKGGEENSLIIKGISFAAAVLATFDPATITMEIGYQLLADYISPTLTLKDMEFLTFDGKDWSDEAVMTFYKNLKGQLVLTPTSEAIGYLIWADAINGGEGDWVNGWYNLVFSPRAVTSSTSLKSSVADPVPVVKTGTGIKKLGNISIVKTEKCLNGNFSIQSKTSIRTNVPFD